MKKLIGLIRTKEQEEKTADTGKKAKANANSKGDKAQNPTESCDQDKSLPRELFWDGYSDIGYC